MGYLLTESTVTLIQNYIKANIETQLAAVRSDRPGGIVQTMSPRSYFFIKAIHNFQCPAIITYCEDFDYRHEKGQNHINALARVNVQVINEDRVRDLLMIRNWRYQAALARLFDGAQIDSSDNRVRLVTKLLRNSFSDLYYEPDNDPENPNTTFTQSVMLELEVEHYEHNT